MKKLFIITLLSLFTICSNLVFAQTGNLIISPHIGAGISKTQSFLSPGITYSGGITAEFKLNDMFSIIGGIFYDHKEARDKINAVDSLGVTIINARINHNYEFLTVPILLKANFGNSDKIKYFINAGPYTSFLLQQSLVSYNLEDNSVSTSINTDLHNKIEAGITIGTGVAINMCERMNLLLELRSNIGLTNLSKTEGATTKTQSALLLLGFGYSF